MKRRNDDHLLINHTDGPAARQIKDLKAEILLLNKNLEEKALEMHPEHGMASFPSWKDKVVSDTSLAHMSPCVLNDKLLVNPPLEVENSGVSKSNDCVVGYFADKKLPFMAFKSIAGKIWGKFGLSEVLSNDKGFFIFQFDQAGAYRQVVSRPMAFLGQVACSQTMASPYES